MTYLDSTIQNAALPENVSMTRPLLEAAKTPLNEPITWDMQQYVDAVRESKVPEAGPRIALPDASSVTAEAGNAPLSAGAKPASALAAESSEAGHAARPSFEKCTGSEQR